MLVKDTDHQDAAFSLFDEEQDLPVHVQGSQTGQHMIVRQSGPFSIGQTFTGFDRYAVLFVCPAFRPGVTVVPPDTVQGLQGLAGKDMITDRGPFRISTR